MSTSVKSPRQPRTTPAHKNNRTPLSRVIVWALLGIAVSVGFLVWWSRNSSIEGIDAVVNARLIDISAPEEGTVASVGSSGQPAKSNLKNVGQGDYCSPLDSSNPQSNAVKPNLAVAQSIEREQVLFTLRNNRYSLLSVYSARKQLCDLESQLRAVDDQINKTDKRKVQASAKGTDQTALEVEEKKARRTELESNLESAQLRQQSAKKIVDRIQEAADQGAISKIVLMDYQDKLTQRSSEVAQLEAQIKVLDANQQAAEKGLSLSRTPSNYDPRNRSEDLDSEISQLQQHQARLRNQQDTAKHEHDQIIEDVQKKQFVEVKAPKAGQLWSLNVQPGQLVKAGEVLGQVALCDELWVDAWVNEQSAQSLVGNDNYKATMTLHGVKGEPYQAKKLQGKVSFVRSGVGRLALGSDKAVKIDPQDALHYAQVRIHQLVEVKDKDKQASGSSNQGTEQSQSNSISTQDQQCRYIGYTGKISFEKTSDISLKEKIDNVWDWFTKFPNPLS
jgi:multidrug resistance efflux pump